MSAASETRRSSIHSDRAASEGELRRALVRKLVESATILAPGAPNFDTACDWAEGNLARHTFLDLNVNRVREFHSQSLDKLRAHARFRQAERLDHLYSLLTTSTATIDKVSKPIESTPARVLSVALCPASPPVKSWEVPVLRQMYTQGPGSDKGQRTVAVFCKSLH